MDLSAQANRFCSLQWIGNVFSLRRVDGSRRHLFVYPLTALLVLSACYASFATAQQPLPNPNLFLLRNGESRAIARQSDGKLLIAANGVANARYLGGAPGIDFATGATVGFSGIFLDGGIARLNVDGTLDTTFDFGLTSVARDCDNSNNNNCGNNDIFDIKIFGNFAYVVGNFSQIGGVARAGLARINLATNTVDASWNPSPTGLIAGQLGVGSIALDGAGNLYTFGSRYNIRGKSNVRMAKIPANSTTGQADPNFDGRTTSIVDDLQANVGIFASPTPNGALYVIGTRSSSGKIGIRKIDAVAGVPDAVWNANAPVTEPIVDMNVFGAVVNAAGDMFVGGQSTGTSTLGQNLTSPYHLVKLSGITGQVAPGWVGGRNGTLPVIGVAPAYTVRSHAGLSLDAAGNLFALAGRFYGDTITFSPAKYDAATGLPVAGFNGLVVAGGNSFTGYVLATPEGIYIEGRDYYGTARTGAVIRLDANTGTLASNFNVNLKNSGFISSSTRLADGRVVMGGSFTEANGVALNNLIRFNADGTFDPTFTNGPNGLVVNVKEIAGKLYVSGGFAYSGTASRQFLARYDATTAALDTTWSPVIDGLARAITGDAGNIYMVGGFYTVDGVVTRCLAKLSATTGALDTSWLPLMANTSFGSQCQRSIAKVGNFIYVGMPNNQNFSGIPRLVVNGQNRTLARIDATTGLVDNSYDPNPNGTAVSAMEFDGTNIYVSGNFSSIGGVSTRLAKLSGATGAIDTTFVQPLTGIPANPFWIRSSAAGIFLTGNEAKSTSTVGTSGSPGDIRPYYWKILPNGSRDAQWGPVFDFNDPGSAFLATLEPLGTGRVIVGGGFSSVGINEDVLRLGVAAFSTASAASLTFNQIGRGTYVIGSNSAAGINASCNDCAPGATTYQFDQGSALTLTVRAAPGWTFAGWSGASGNATCTGRNACTFTINTPSAVTATFTKVRDLIEE